MIKNILKISAVIALTAAMTSGCGVVKKVDNTEGSTHRDSSSSLSNELKNDSNSKNYNDENDATESMSSNEDINYAYDDAMSFYKCMVSGTYTEQSYQDTLKKLAQSYPPTTDISSVPEHKAFDKWAEEVSDIGSFNNELKIYDPCSPYVAETGDMKVNASTHLLNISIMVGFGKGSVTIDKSKIKVYDDGTVVVPYDSTIITTTDGKKYSGFDLKLVKKGLLYQVDAQSLHDYTVESIKNSSV